MKGKEIKEEVDIYLLTIREARKDARIAKVPEFDERDVKQAYRDGLKSGLWHHGHDYLVKTNRLKESFKKQLQEACDNSNGWMEAAVEEKKKARELKKENKVLAQNLEDTEILNNTYEKRFDNLKKEKTELEKENAVLERRIERAKECMKKLLFIINSDPANYNCKGLVQDAEDFIYNRTCNIRQQGEHCISETRCIMCDK